MSKFLLLLRGGDFADYSEQEMQQIVERYKAWSEKLRKDGKHIASEALKNDGRMMKSQAGQIVDGPFAETKEAVGGFYLIEADSFETAKETAKGCPHLDYGGTIELREIAHL